MSQQPFFIQNNHLFFLPQSFVQVWQVQAPPLDPLEKFVERIDPRNYFLPIEEQFKYCNQNSKFFARDVSYAKGLLNTSLGEVFRLHYPPQYCLKAAKATSCTLQCPYIHHYPLMTAMVNLDKEEPLPTAPLDEPEEEAEQTEASTQTNEGEADDEPPVHQQKPGPITPPPGFYDKMAKGLIEYHVEQPVGLKGLN